MKYHGLTVLGDEETFTDLAGCRVVLVPESALQGTEITDSLRVEIPADEDGINTREVDVCELPGTIRLDLEGLVTLWRRVQARPELRGLLRGVRK